MSIRLRMVGEDVLLAHWPLAPERLRPHVPESLDLDTYDGSAWIGVLAFRVTESRPDGVPLPSFGSFPQLNLRTYVSYDGEPGVYFISSDAPTRLGVEFGRQYLHLPMYESRIEMRTQRDSSIYFRSRRTQRDAPPARFTAEYTPRGESFSAGADPRDSFLIERNHYFIPGDEQVYRGTIQRGPWELREVDVSIETNTLFDTVGVSAPDNEPIVRFSDGFDMSTNRPQPTEQRA